MLLSENLSRPWRRRGSSWLFPAILAANLLIATHVVASVSEPSPWVPTLAVFSLACAHLAERWFPGDKAPAQAGETRADWLFFGSTACVDAFVVSWFTPHHPGSNPVEENLAVTVVGALLLWEFGSYWAHRLGHAWSPLWKLHALHHAPARLTVLNNFRLHPLDLVVKEVFALGALALCGFGPRTLLFVPVIKNCVVAFQHADADLQHGWLNRIFSTNTAHRWHHSTDPAEGNTNFGTVLLVWDVVFGTLRVAEHGRAPKAMGLFGGLPYPTHQWIRSLLSPFCWQRCTEPKGAAPCSR